MPLTSADLLNAVASFMQRKPQDFVKNGFDVLLRAANNARLFAERQIDFELARVQVTIPAVNILNGGSLDDAVLFGTATPVVVKKIKRPFLQYGTNSNAFPIGFYSRDSWLFRLKRLWERTIPRETTTFTSLAEAQWWTRDFVGLLQTFALVQIGRTVYITPADRVALGIPSGTDTMPVHLDVIKYLPDYGTANLEGLSSLAQDNKLIDTTADFLDVKIGSVVYNTTQGTSAIVTAVESSIQLGLSGNIFDAGEGYELTVLNQEDFLLDNCFDWLMYRTVWELNYFLKEDERVAISRDLINESWEAVKSWNENLVNLATDNSDLE